MNPAWIAPAAAEAHRLGLHVHGHVPATMRPLEAVHAGYDELTHLNFIGMQAMPQVVVAEATMDGGTPAPAYAPYMGIMSPVLDRTLKAGGHPVVEGLTRDDYRESYAKMVHLVRVLHDAGVTIVAGTDGWGIELVRELELYHSAGCTLAAALQGETIVPARVVGADARTGSIAVGKEAGILVDGDVSTDLGALRRVVTVISDSYVMDADALRAAAGYGGRPK